MTIAGIEKREERKKKRRKTNVMFSPSSNYKSRSTGMQDIFITVTPYLVLLPILQGRMRKSIRTGAEIERTIPPLWS